MSTEFLLLPIEALHESAHNPRRHFDGAALDELAESIRTVGILTPLLVRPKAKGYEIAAGHRRYRAALQAELSLVPCLVRELTDAQFMEILTIENLQREDVHPLDEAKGYEALMAAPYSMPVERIAARVGRSVKYVYDRVKLLALCEEAQTLFWDGKIEAGHAILLARLTPEAQRRVIGAPQAEEHGGLFQVERRLFDSDEAEEAYLDRHGEPLKAVSVRELDRYIKEHVRFNGPQADPFLFPETVEKVAEATQDKMKVIEITREYLAGDDVRKDGGGKIYGERAWKRADGRDGCKACDHAVMGVVVCGPGQGAAFFVCINKERCAVHWGKEMKERAARRKALEQGGPAADKAKTAQQRQEAQWERERREQQAKEDRYKAAQSKIVAAVVERVTALPAKPTGCLADLLIEAVTGRLGRGGKALPRGKSFEELLRHLASTILIARATEWGAYRDFPKVAKRIGLNLDALLPALPAAASAQTGKPVKKIPRRVA